MDIVIVLAIIAAFVWWFLADKKVEKVTLEPVEPVDPPRDLSELTKAELLEVAEDSGVEVKKSWTKAKIVQVLEAEFAARSGFER